MKKLVLMIAGLAAATVMMSSCKKECVCTVKSGGKTISETSAGKLSKSDCKAQEGTGNYYGYTVTCK